MFRLWNSHITLVNLMVLSRRNMSIESTQCGPAEVKNSDNRSIHSDSVEEVHSVPMNVIIRPIPSVLDELKVQSLMNTIKVTCYFIYTHVTEDNRASFKPGTGKCVAYNAVNELTTQMKSIAIKSILHLIQGHLHIYAVQDRGVIALTGCTVNRNIIEIDAMCWPW